MIDLYTAVKLCSYEAYIRIFDDEYTPEQIAKKFDMRNIKVSKIFFDRWHGCMCFEAVR